MNRTPITIVVVVILCAIGFAYSQGWLNMSRPAAEMEGAQVGTSQMTDQDESKADAVQVSQKPTGPARPITE